MGKFSNEIVEGKKKPALDPVGQEDEASITMKRMRRFVFEERRKVRSRIIKKEDYEPSKKRTKQQRFFGMVRAFQKGKWKTPRLRFPKLLPPCPSPT